LVVHHRQAGGAVAVLRVVAHPVQIAEQATGVLSRRVAPAEVLVEGEAARLIRRRQTLDDVLALEI